MKPITLNQAKKLKKGTILYQIGGIFSKGSDGRPRRWVVNGMPKTWKRSLGRVQVPLKHGLYSFNYLDESNLKYFSLQEE